MKRFFTQPFIDCLEPLGHIMGTKRPAWPTFLMLASLIVSWFIYVPIHELMHVWGCQLTGGTVTELQLDAKYGGAILARIFPYVVSGSDYAGRLTGFDTKGSDWIYLATDFGPFLLTILIGVPLLKICARRRHPILFGTAIVVGLAPIYQLTGDYFEMGSIVTTRAVTMLGAGDGEAVAFVSLRSDDIFRLFGEIFTKAGELGLDTPVRLLVGLVVILVSLVAAILLALATYWLGRAFANVAVPPRGMPAGPFQGT